MGKVSRVPSTDPAVAISMQGRNYIIQAQLHHVHVARDPEEQATHSHSTIVTDILTR